MSDRRFEDVYPEATPLLLLEGKQRTAALLGPLGPLSQANFTACAWRIGIYAATGV